MLRSALLKNARTSRGRVAVPPARNQSTKSGGGGGVMGKLLFGLTAAGAGTLGYARVDPGFAKTLKDNVPVLEPVLTALGCDTSGSKGAPAFPVTPKSVAPVILPKPADVEPPSMLKVKKTIDSVKDLKEVKEHKEKDEAKKPRGDSGDSKENELRRQKQNFILEQSLRDATASAERVVSEASSELEAAAERTEDYAIKLMRALDEAAGVEDHHMWQAANEAKIGQTAAQAKAETKATDAVKVLQRLHDAIQKGRSDPATADNMNLVQAEQTLSKLSEKVEEASTKVSKQLEKLDFAKQFNSAIEESKKQLMDEVNALLPPGKMFTDVKKLSNEDLNMLILHAHKKIETLSRELSRMQLTDDEKGNAFRQQLAALDKEVARQKSEVAKMVAAKVNEEREAFEVELQNQLRRQIGVHTEHLKEALEDQKSELMRNRQMEIERAREEERSQQVARLSDAVQLLQNMEQHLHTRKLLDEASKKAKSLWLSCAALKHVLSQGRTDKREPQPLAADIVPLREVSESSPFVKTVLSSIPDEALKRGVYPETTLKERFYKVETVCRRLALMEDLNGGGPGRHLLSYLMSLFMIYPKPVPQEELDKEQKVNPLMWDTYDILSRVRASLQKDDLEQALRYANQLKGEPRQAARDWISEVRLLLETRQATNALMAYAAATVGEDVPK